MVSPTTATVVRRWSRTVRGSGRPEYPGGQMTGRRSCPRPSQRASRLIGRILLGAPRHRDALSSHPSRRAVAGTLVRPTRRLGRAVRSATEVAGACAAAPTSRRGLSWSCSQWGLPSRPGHPGRWWSLTPPFHPYPHPGACAGAAGGLSLWHCPASCLGWVLPTTVPCGVRTFLSTVRRSPPPPCRGRPVGSPAPGA